MVKKLAKFLWLLVIAIRSQAVTGNQELTADSLILTVGYVLGEFVKPTFANAIPTFDF